VIGQSQMAEPAAQILLQSADAVTDDESLQLALFDDGDVFLEEDLL
jgi:hypothetical protein